MAGSAEADGFSLVHLDDTPFAAEGLRAFFAYRDLGIKGATGGRVGAQVIRARPGRQSEPEWHVHDVEFQMIYVTRGWFRFEYEGHGEVTLRPGSCVCQPPGIRHRELGHSDDAELIEITLPAGFATHAAEAPSR
ncbi:MAG: cupin domain-containing protein [Rhodospirillales bacterium]|nr:MAG: cupin domain-containing protein [Rhodospirillales bacterium]